MKQILILEDNELIRNRLIRIIKEMKQKVSVYAFSSEEEALGFALIHGIDLFLVDIILHPKRRNDFSGITFVEKIRECSSCAGAQVIFITSLAGLEVDLLHRVHCYDYIEKPMKRFLNRVRDSIFLSPLRGTAVNIAYIESVERGY